MSEGFKNLQAGFAAHLRDPDNVAPPPGIEDRRMKIYRDLIFNNVDNFVSTTFPVLKSLIDAERWRSMVRDFMVHHQCHSPYFLEISVEFLQYLQTERKAESWQPAFLLELAHYEWVELALNMSDEEFPECRREGDLLADRPRVSPLAWNLSYQFPVHRIGPDFQPSEAGPNPSFLVVYRQRNDKVGFLEANGVTHRLISLLGDGELSGQQALEQIAKELEHPQPQVVIDGGRQTLELLMAREILCGFYS